MTLQLPPSELPCIWEKFSFLFYQCTLNIIYPRHFEHMLLKCEIFNLLESSVASMRRDWKKCKILSFWSWFRRFFFCKNSVLAHAENMMQKYFFVSWGKGKNRYCLLLNSFVSVQTDCRKYFIFTVFSTWIKCYVCKILAFVVNSLCVLVNCPLKKKCMDSKYKMANICTDFIFPVPEIPSKIGFYRVKTKRLNILIWSLWLIHKIIKRKNGN